MLDPEFLYLSHELTNTEIIIHVQSTNTGATCPYCGTISVSASDYLRNHGIEVSKSVICELIKNA